MKLKKGTRSYKNKAFVRRAEEDWARVENTHGAIISQEVWDAAQRVDLNRYDPATGRTPERSLFSGLLRCLDCGHTLSHNTEKQVRRDGRVVRYSSYGCSYHQQTGRSECSSHRIYELTLLAIIREDVRSQLAFAEPCEELIARKLWERRSLPSLEDTKKELAQLSDRIAELDALGASLYEDRLTGKVTPETFKALSAAGDTERSEKQAERDRLARTLAEAEQVSRDVTEWVSCMREYLTLEQPDRDTLRTLIERIEVGEREGRGKERRQDIHIVYRFVGRMGGAEHE